jgi:hypothetical protein
MDQPICEIDYKKAFTRGFTFIASLPPSMEGSERAEAFREVVRMSAGKSADSIWALEATLQAYHLAGAGIWKI